MNVQEDSQIIKFNKLTLNAYLNFRNLATKTQPPGGHICFRIVTVRHKETLGEKIESAHDCKTDENGWKFESFSRNCTDSLPCNASASAPLVRNMKG